MTARYTWVSWNPHKRRYDAVAALGVALYLVAFVAVGKAVWTGERAISDEVLVIRALGTCALVMLHVALAIGPLTRLSRRFLPLLYNRRHLGVATFLVALAHAGLSTVYYGGFGEANPLVAVLAGYSGATPSTAPFELFGFAALVILFLLAATSHDFWLANLGPVGWKRLHMLIYVAYALLVMHVAFGALQSERSAVYPILLGTGALVLIGLHLWTGSQEARRDKPLAAPVKQDWIGVGTVDEIPDGRAKVVCLQNRERVAVFRNGETLSAISNVCAHQAGPLGEGKIVDGCATCPWHGYQYKPESGQSPPPYTERVPTYRLRVRGRDVFLNPEPLPPGTPVEPARIDGGADG